jgi:hypothetical protein
VLGGGSLSGASCEGGLPQVVRFTEAGLPRLDPAHAWSLYG